uniref:NADH dehydrogenase subunit 6 n=1 Tax=Oxyopes sertatus TaxID=93706 RepID=A0A0U1XBF0_OXYSE|nr:NADH dehydrogenase subunit 6 [Oxyopes sertatus]AIP86903.1 NADH dehydrogenase subunit 6 [Oxyopes sertatus]
MNLIFLLGVFFVVSLQPVFMVSILIFITLFYSYLIYKVIGTFWFSYMLLMVMLSGVLVIFTYMVSLVPNESFEVVNLVILLSFMISMFVKWGLDFGGDMGIMSMDLWISYLGGFSLFLVVFLLVIMLLVVVVSCMSGMGSFRVSW